jgi:hypothetical protein
MPSTDRKLELKAKASMAQTASQAAVYAKGIVRFEIHGKQKLQQAEMIHYCF